MKKCYLSLLALAAVFSLSAQMKLDPAGMRIADEYRILKSGGEVMNPDVRLAGSLTVVKSDGAMVMSDSRAGSLADAPIGAIVSLMPGYTLDDLNLDGVEINTVISKTLFTATIPVGRLEEFSSQKAIKTVSVGDSQQAFMFAARPSGYVEEVQAGNGLSQPFNGQGVIVGMYDTGMDPNHINFTEMDNNSVSRVKRVWAYVNSTTPTSTLTTPEEIAGFTTDFTTKTHGTHVMGIAAGAYNGKGTWRNNRTLNEDVPNMPLYGVATGSDIVMAGGTLYNSAIVDGIARQMDYAESTGQPIAVNVSLGSILGPHDGTDGVSESFAELGKRGIICVAAGNDGDSKLSFVMQGGGLQAQTLRNTVGFSNYVSGDVPTIQVWNDSAEPFEKLEFVIFDVTSKQVVYAYEIPNTGGNRIGIGGSSTSSSYTHPGSDFDNAFTASGYITFRTFTNSGNSKYVAEIQNRLYAGSNSYKPCLRITRKRGQYVYGVSNKVTFSNYNQTSTYTQDDVKYAAFTDGTTNGTISAMATGSNIIAVGAYTSTVNFGFLSGGGYSYTGHSEIDQVCPFSSYGINTVDKRSLPDLSAPGSVILSSLNSYYRPSGGIYAESSGTASVNGNSYYWGPMQGTSMACPYITGTTALMLEADPTLTVDDVRSILTQTATKTSQYANGTTDIKSQWGAGKIQALEAVKETLSRKASIGSVFNDNENRLIVNQAGGTVDVFVAGETALNARLFAVTGALVGEASAAGDSVQLDASLLGKGVYVLTVDGSEGRYTRKIVVR